MTEARVRSLDALNTWRSSLIVFQTKARRGVSQVTDEVKRLRAMEQRVNVAKAMCDESVGGVIDPGTLRAVLWA